MLTVSSNNREKCRKMVDEESFGGDVLSSYPGHKFSHFFIQSILNEV